MHDGAVETQIEIENKFEAVESVEVTGLDSIEGVVAVAPPAEHQLDADYFDTADLRLFRAGIVLRRRLGGSDEGWHVKLRQPDGSRTEVHEPVGDSPTSVPESLRRLLVLYAHHADLVAIATIRNHRTVHLLLDGHGQPVAEVCDDHVDASSTNAPASSWRELEVELVGAGDRALLERVSDHLVHAGAEPSTWPSKLSRALGDPPVDEPPPEVRTSSTAGDVVAAYLGEQVRAMRHLDPAVRIDAEDAVHKMRVAVRRLRSTLATYDRLVDRDVTEPIRDELKWLGEVLGAARDAEVIRSYLDQAVADQPPSLVIGPVLERIDSTTTQEHADAHRRAVDELTSERYLALMAELDHLTDAVGGPRAQQRARPRLRKEIRRTHRRMRRHLDQALEGGDPSDAQLHDVRKSIKRVRYAAEAVEAVFGKRSKRYAKRMEEAQETLGDEQDSVVVRAVLLRLAADATAAGESAFTYGRLHAFEEQRGNDRAAQFLRDIDRGWARRPHWLG